MFQVSTFLEILFKYSKRVDWTDPKKLTEGVTMILEPDSFAHETETFYNKFFKGTNKGRTLYQDIGEVIERIGFSDYIFKVEERFLNKNHNERNISVVDTLEEFRTILETDTPPRDIQLGLLASYASNKTTRPYLFLAECLFYSLAILHNKNTSYCELDLDNSASLANPLFDKALFLEGDYSARTYRTLNLLTEDELSIFKKIAPLTFYDCAEDELSGELVEDRYLISHEDYFDLFEKYGVKAVEISKMIECGLLSSGGVHELVVEKGYLSGFQNDNLILTLTTESDEIFTLSYKAFHVTQAGKDLIEILEIETDDEFFRELKELFERKTSKTNILSINIFDI